MAKLNYTTRVQGVCRSAARRETGLGRRGEKWFWGNHAYLHVLYLTWQGILRVSTLVSMENDLKWVYLSNSRRPVVSSGHHAPRVGSDSAFLPALRPIFTFRGYRRRPADVLRLDASVGRRSARRGRVPDLPPDRKCPRTIRRKRRFGRLGRQ